MVVIIGAKRDILTTQVSNSGNYAKRLAKGSTIVLTALIFSEIIAIVMRAFLARSLSPEEYGLFFGVFTVVSFFTLFRDLGLNSSLIKHIPEFAFKKQHAKIKSSIASVALIQSVAGFIILAVLLFFSDHIAITIFGTLKASIPLKILSLWFFVMIFVSLAQSAFNGLQNMFAYVLVNTINISLVLVLVVLIVGFFGYGTSGVSFAYVSAAVLTSVFSWAFFIERYPQVSGEKTSITKANTKKLFIFALPLVAAGSAGLIIGYMDTIMIAMFRGLFDTGLYQAAQPMARILWYFSTALTMVLFPIISEIWAKREKNTLKKALHFLTKFSFIIILPIILVFISFPEIVINLIFGPNYVAAAMAFRILCAGQVVYILYKLLLTAMLGVGKSIVNLTTMFAMSVVNFFGNAMLIPLYGIEGAAVATFFSYLVGFILIFHYSGKIIKFPAPAKSIFKSLGGGVLMLLLIIALKSVFVMSPWIEAFVVVIPSLLFYCVWILATKAITKDDLRLIAKVVPIPKRLIALVGKIIR